MTLRSKDDAASLRALARSMYFSNSTIDAFLETATAAEARCVSDLIAAELEERERNKPSRCTSRAAPPTRPSPGSSDAMRDPFPTG